MPRTNPKTGRKITSQKEKKGHLTTSGRLGLSRSQFALPPTEEQRSRGMKGRYPIDTPERARSALSRVEANGTPEEQKRVRAAVKRKYPKMVLSK